MDNSNNFKTSSFAIFKFILNVLKIITICIFGPIVFLFIIALFNQIGIIEYAFVVPIFLFFFVGLAATADPTNLVFSGKTHLIMLGIVALSTGLTTGKLLGLQWGVLFSGSIIYIYYVYRRLVRD